MKRMIAIGAAALACAGLSYSGHAGGAPDIARQHFERQNCYGAYDLLVEDNNAGRPISADDLEWAKSYETAGNAGQPCPRAPGALLARASNRVLTDRDSIIQANKYRESDPTAKFELAMSVLTGKFTEVGPEVGWGMLKEASDAGEPSAQFFLGSVIAGGLFNNNQPDYAGGRPLVEQVAEAGHVDALFMAGNMYKEGLGAKKDARKAFEYYRQAAERGHVYATLMAFTMINEGEGTKKDFDLAYRLARNVAEQGEVYGAVMAASALLQDRDPKKHKDEALYWMDVAIRDGDESIRSQIVPLRAQAMEIFNRPPPPPREYRPRPFKACPTKTVCLVARGTGATIQCTTNKDYWNDCDG